ncbi:MAG: flagellar biosynthesis protein [Ideonella sp.]|jgi:flagellar biosynthesis protein FlhG|nr:flagellar biosynthesis protein [Ideonella sp.]
MFSTGSAPPEDQADGLRRLFAPVQPRVLPVVSNPHVQRGGMLLERLCSAVAELGLHTLVVDAGERSPGPQELAKVDLASCVETLSRDVSYLAARGLALRYVDAEGSTASLLPALADAAPQAQVLLVHAGATDLARLLAVRATARPAAASLPRPVLLADDHPASVTHAYAAIKILSQRAGLWVHDLLLGAARTSSRAPVIPGQLARCAEDFLGASIGHWAQVDPASPPHSAAPRALRRLVESQLGAGPASPASAIDLFESLGEEPAVAFAPASASPSARSRHAFPEL